MFRAFPARAPARHAVRRLSSKASFPPKTFTPPPASAVVDPAKLFAVPRTDAALARARAAATAAARKKAAPLFPVGHEAIAAAAAVARQRAEGTDAAAATASSAAASRAPRVPHKQNPPRRSTLVPADPAEAKAFAQPWRITASLLLQRTPVVARPLEPEEENWADLKAKRYVQKQRAVDFVRPEALVLRKKSDIEAEAEEEVDPTLPKFDYAAWEAQEDVEEDIDQVPVPLVTKDDQTKNHKSLHRRLWECLYLIVKKPRAEHAWQFPQGGLKRGESIREAAEREFEEECGEGVDYHTIANHPCGMHQYQYPAAAQQQHGTYGARVFFLPALYLNGDIKVDGKEIVDYAWVTVDEMKDYLSPDLYAKVKQFLQ